MSVVRQISTILALAAFVSGSAYAADMQLPPQSPPLGQQERLEFGTGWYLRGDISWAREKTPAIFPDIAFGGSSKLQNSYSLTIGGGYKFNNWFRTDLTYDYFKPANLTAQSAPFTCYDSINPINNAAGNVIGLHAQQNSCYSRQTGTLSRHAILLNGYIDLGTWSGVSPYVGAGVGTVISRAAGNTDWYTAADGQHYGATLTMPNPSPIPEIWYDAAGNPIARPVNNFGTQDHRASISRRNFNMAWALMAGVAYDVSPNAKIDMGYRYINLGKFGTGTKTNTVSEYRIGVRYMID